ncbi:MAG: hypothetical protein AMJ81_14040 [Phycisphaerae bacterium SM23_33]|jgi:hypothetical protein|nr:MAG: hypothetical protein AMJ81_14040 [Phycisphaerae bacterium SM23_33]
MKDTQNTTIAVLCVSAAILATVLIVTGLSGPARADSPVAGGEYIMITGAYSSGTDILYIVDLRVQRLHAYAFDRTNNSIRLADSVNLERAFATK